MQLSSGPWAYNRFDQYERVLTEKKADKDYDGDGKVESSKAEYFGSKDKAIKKAMGKEVKEENLDEGMPPWLKDKEGDDKKDEKKSSCKKCKDEGKKDCDCDDKKSEDKDDKKPAFLQKEAIINSLMADGLANNPVSAEIIAEHMSEAWAQAILDEAE